jgi:hypothetical protein
MDARSREWGTTEAVGTGFGDRDSCESDFRVWSVTEVQTKLHASNEKYKEQADKHRRQKVFEVGDRVMVHLHKEKFQTGTYNKLKNKKIGPVPIIRKINDNAYVVDLLDDMTISRTFNVADLTEYHEPEHDENSRTNSFEVEETDVERVAGSYMAKMDQKRPSQRQK